MTFFTPEERRACTRSLARALTRIENGDSVVQDDVRAAWSSAGNAHRIGITGAPGTGKSTLVTALTRAWRSRGRSVAILSIDPSSPITGGAILGDRIRMRELSGDPDVFIRSMASRGASGGLASAAADATALLDAHGFDVVVIETVGAGQSEVDVVRLADSVVVVEAPGMGDDVQAIKAGILEIADVLVVNKADRPGAERTVAALQAALDLAAPAAGHHGVHEAVETAHDVALNHGGGWVVPVLSTTASTGDGVAALADALQRHREWLSMSGVGVVRATRRCEIELLVRLREHLLQRALRIIDPEIFASAQRAVVEGRSTPSDAAHSLASRLIP
jgi:LAO/AO transport system kinase